MLFSSNKRHKIFVGLKNNLKYFKVMNFYLLLKIWVETKQ